MEKKLTKKEFQCLLQLVYAGSRALFDYSDEPPAKENEAAEQYIFSLAEEFGLIGVDSWILKEPSSGMFLPGNALCDTVDPMLDECRENSFWDELLTRLVSRDLVSEMGEDAVEKMEFEERFEKEEQCEEKYVEEFEKNGVLNLHVKK